MENKKVVKADVVVGWAVMHNTDGTEGRGSEEPLYFTENKSTALRMGKGKYIQGSDCPVKECKFLRIGTTVYLPTKIYQPPKEDKEVEEEFLKLEELKKLLGEDRFREVERTILFNAIN